MRDEPAGGGIVRKSAADLPVPSAADLERLRAAMEGPIDCSDIPEHIGPFRRLQRDASGRLPRRRSPIREAIRREADRQALDAAGVWELASPRYPSLSKEETAAFLDRPGDDLPRRRRSPDGRRGPACGLDGLNPAGGIMTIQMAPDLEARLREAAGRASVSVNELADRILRAYLDAPPRADDERAWITATQAGLARVWPVEDFSDWSPPSA